MVSLLDQAMMVANSTGTGTITLGATLTGFQSLAAAGVVNNQVFSYGIQDSSNTWELGRGTYITNTSGNFVARTTIKFSSNAGGPINLSGTGSIYATFLDDDYETLTPANSINIGANVIINTSVFFTGNSTANSFGNSTIEIWANSTSQTVITPLSISIGNSTANTFQNSIFYGTVNSTANTQTTPGKITLAGAGSNQGLTVGTASIAANGYSFLPNGLLLQWGQANANSTATKITFPTAFPTAVFSVILTANNLAVTINSLAWLVNSNSSAFNMITANTTNVHVTWIATGN